jgi:hypothetical protein
MHTVKVSSIVSAMADKELRSTGIASCMRHRKYAGIVKLILSIGLTINRVSRAPSSITFWAAALDHKIVKYPVKGQSVVKTFFSEVSKIFHSIWCIFFEELQFHYSFPGVYLGIHSLFLLVIEEREYKNNGKENANELSFIVHRYIGDKQQNILF